MFSDARVSARTVFGIACSWDRYVFFVTLWTAWSAAIAAAAIHDIGSACRDGERVAYWLLSVCCLHLFSLLLLSSLRDRRDSLHVKSILILRAAQAALVFLTTLAAFALTIALAASVSAYSASSSPSCPPRSSSFLFVSAGLSIPLSFLCSPLHLSLLLVIVYHRLVFMHPPVKDMVDDSEREAITWIRARDGCLIPTLLIVPPTVDPSRCASGVFPCSAAILYSHGNAMDLSDGVYVMRALAETFDCAVLGYEFPGYGLCSGSVSEDGCNAAIEAAFHCLTAYHRVQPLQVLLYGRSLGSGPSTHLANLLASNVGGLVLQSAMLSVARVGCPCLRRTLPFDLFPSCDLLPALRLPVFIVHGEKDTVVPFSHALELQSLLSPDSVFPPLWVPDGDHADMPKPWLYSTERFAADSEQRRAEKQRVNARNQTFITRMREFMLHCQLRAQHLQAAGALSASLSASDSDAASPLPPLSLQSPKQLIHPRYGLPVPLHPEAEEKEADALPEAGKRGTSAGTEDTASVLVSAPLLSPMRSVPARAASTAPAFPTLPVVLPVLAASVSSPLPPVHPLQPAALSLPPSPRVGDSPPFHVRSQSATAAVRPSSRVAAFPSMQQSLTLERLLEEAQTTELRLLRQDGASGGWRLDGAGRRRRRERGVSAQPLQAQEMAEAAAAADSLSDSPPLPSRSSGRLHSDVDGSPAIAAAASAGSALPVELEAEAEAEAGVNVSIRDTV